MRGAGIFISLVLLTGCASTSKTEVAVPPDLITLEADARALLDELHAAAAAADERRYFGCFAADGVFLGTDATERWTVEQFRAYARPHFDRGKGWTYTAARRFVDVDPVDGRYAWFHEELENARLGPCRGTGLLRREGGAWKVVQYDLTIPIPNDLADETADRIKAHLSAPPGPR